MILLCTHTEVFSLNDSHSMNCSDAVRKVGNNYFSYILPKLPGY